MSKRLVQVTLALVSAVLMSSCTPGNNTGGATAVGAATGGLVASQFFHGSGSAAGVIAGTILGGMIGNNVGQYMDRQDRINMQNAIVQTPVGQQASWTNSKDVTYQVRPIKNYYAHTKTHKRAYCREYQTKITVNGKVQSAYGKACRQPDGSWKIQS